MKTLLLLENINIFTLYSDRDRFLRKYCMIPKIIPMLVTTG